jgi:hypothetical protein
MKQETVNSKRAVLAFGISIFYPSREGVMGVARPVPNKVNPDVKFLI